MSYGGQWRGGFDRFADWVDAPKVWLLGGPSFGFVPTDDVIADIAGMELVATGYTRKPLVAPVLEFFGDESINIANYGGEAPEWLGMTLLTYVGSLVLALDDGDDATSGLICWWPISSAVDDGDLTIGLAPWEHDEDPLPGGDVNTRKIHESKSWVQT